MKKQVIALCLAGVLTLGLAGCSTPGVAVEDTIADPLPRDIRIGLLVYIVEGHWWYSMHDAMEAQADALGARIVTQDFNLGQDDEIVHSFVAQGIDVLAICPWAHDMIEPVLLSAADAHLPVVFYNRQPSQDFMDSYDKVWYVGARAEDSGTESGKILADYFKEFPAADKNGDGKVQYVMLTGEINHQDAVARSKYSQQALAASGLIDGYDMNEWSQSSPPNQFMLANQSANWDTRQAKDLMNNWITSIGLDKIEAVIANSDTMALGAIAALQSKGYNLAGSNSKGNPSKYIPVVGVDGTDKARTAVSKGSLLGTVFNDAVTQGKAVVNAAVAAANGDVSEATVGHTMTEDKYIWVPYTPLTKV